MYSLILVTALSAAADTPRPVTYNAAPVRTAVPYGAPYGGGDQFCPNCDFGCCPTDNVDLFLPCPPGVPCPPAPPSAPRGMCGPRVNTYPCPTPITVCPCPPRPCPAPCP
jgi:hypothetical protein